MPFLLSNFVKIEKKMAVNLETLHQIEYTTAHIQTWIAGLWDINSIFFEFV